MLKIKTFFCFSLVWIEFINLIFIYFFKGHIGKLYISHLNTYKHRKELLKSIVISIIFLKAKKYKPKVVINGI